MAKEMEFLKLGLKVLNGSGRYVIAVSIAMVVVWDGCSRLVWLVGRAVKPASDGEPS